MDRESVNQPSGKIEWLAARAALLDLRTRAAHETEVARDRIRIAPDSRILSADEAAAELARRAKPLQCEATVEEDVLVVRCDPLSEEQREVHERQRLASEERWKTIGERILLTGREDSLPMPKAAFVRWQRDYVVNMLGWMSGGEATEDQRRLGVDWVWMVGGGRGKTYYLDVPEERGAAAEEILAEPELPEAMRSLILESIEAVSEGGDALQVLWESLEDEDAANEERG